MRDMIKNFQFQKQLLWLNGALPALLLAWDWRSGNLGANPPEAFIRSTGVIAIVFFTLALAVSPLVKLLGWSWLMKHRRWLGLWAFYYGFLHLIAYSIFDRGLIFSEIFKDIQKRPFILLGFSSFLLMLPLAVTSTNDFIRKLGAKKWKLLHKLTYLIAILLPIHYWMIVKSDIFYPALFAAFMSALMLYRLFKYLQTRLAL
jgi:sulfoxide reductase heme-binding subunit YedZ